jgi:hypothetical protein
VLVSGGENNQGGNLVNAILATWLTKDTAMKTNEQK